MRRVRCVRSSAGPSPVFLQGRAYDVITDFVFGGEHYYRVRLENGSEINSEAEQFQELEDFREARPRFFTPRVSQTLGER